MFSGIAEEKARVKKISKTAGGYKLTVESETASKGSEAGDSISINGACLTVVQVKGKNISFDVMEETLRKTTLSDISAGKKVNLERSLKVGDKISGHYVTGHVDCVVPYAMAHKGVDGPGQELRTDKLVKPRHHYAETVLAGYQLALKDVCHYNSS